MTALSLSVQMVFTRNHCQNTALSVFNVKSGSKKKKKDETDQQDIFCDNLRKETYSWC